MSEALLRDRDYTVLIARTAPSVTQMPPGFADRWAAAAQAIHTLVSTCEQLDPDGITIFLSSAEMGEPFKQYRNVTSANLTHILDQHYPPEELNLLKGLTDALEDYLARKALGQTKANGEIILVLIDGEPKERMEIARTIATASKKIVADQELGIGFVQIGDDLIARGFLDALDQNLKISAGAQFDIVHTCSLTDITPNSLMDFLLDILQE
jgi:hypothetical protein